jgi:tRNA-2-methylthio-N6-dimethylallyladenosine synthase
MAVRDEFSDSEIVASILSTNGYNTTNPGRSRFGFVNTCSIRDKAEQTVRKREKYNAVKRINLKMKVGFWAVWQNV